MDKITQPTKIVSTNNKNVKPKKEKNEDIFEKIMSIIKNLLILFQFIYSMITEFRYLVMAFSRLTRKDAEDLLGKNGQLQRFAAVSKLISEFDRISKKEKEKELKNSKKKKKNENNNNDNNNDNDNDNSNEIIEENNNTSFIKTIINNFQKPDEGGDE